MDAISARPWRRNGCQRNTAAFAAIDPEFEAEEPPWQAKGLNLATSGLIHATTVSPRSRHRHDPPPTKPTSNPASAPQQGQQGGFCLEGSNAAGPAPDPSVLQTPNRPATPAGPDGAGSGDHSLDHLAADQCGGSSPGHFATKSADNNPVHAAAFASNGRRASISRPDRLPLRAMRLGPRHHQVGWGGPKQACRSNEC